MTVALSPFMHLKLKQNRSVLCRLFLGLIFGAQAAIAANVSLSWNASSSSAAAGYNVYYGTTSGNYTSKISVNNTTNATIQNLNAGGTYYFVATTFDANGNESDRSNETQFIVPGLLTMTRGASGSSSPVQINFPVAPTHWYEIQASTNL